VTSSALQSRKWQLIGMSQWRRGTLCGHPLPALTENWTHGAASRHTVAPVSHTRPSRRSRYLETAGGVLLLLVCLSVCVFVCYIRLYFGKKRYSVMEFSVLTGNGLVW